jgi:hypothetical protein
MRLHEGQINRARIAQADQSAMTCTILPFPVSTACSGRTMPGLTTPELRQRAMDNFYHAYPV